MDIQQQNIQSFFFDDYTVFLMPTSGRGGQMYLIKEDAYGAHETRRVAKDDVAFVLENEKAPFAKALNVRFFQSAEHVVEEFSKNRIQKIEQVINAPVKVNLFTKYGASPSNEQVGEILLECDDMGIRPPYREILSWIELTSEDDVPAPEVIIPEEWDAYKGEMGLRDL